LRCYILDVQVFINNERLSIFPKYDEDPLSLESPIITWFVVLGRRKISKNNSIDHISVQESPRNIEITT